MDGLGRKFQNQSTSSQLDNDFEHQQALQVQRVSKGKFPIENSVRCCAGTLKFNRLTSRCQGKVVRGKATRNLRDVPSDLHAAKAIKFSKRTKGLITPP